MSSAPHRPRFRDSAAIVLVRGDGAAREVFWVRRGDAVSFMPGFDAFVGGLVGPGDIEIPIEGAHGEQERSLRACALRELFEEIGVLLGRSGDLDRARLADARERLLSGEATFNALVAEHHWKFHADDLPFAGRWTTPPFSSARFDTTYFLGLSPAGQEASVETGELARGEWIAPARALERWREGDATFAAPILRTLEELARGDDDLVARLASAPERAGQPVRRIELKWGIVLQPMKTKPLPPATHTNTYLIGEGEMILLDPGSDDAGELDALFRLIDTLATDGRRAHAIVVSHAHPDHVAGVEAARARLGVPVWSHADTGRSVRLDRALADGETIALASPGRSWDLRVLHTPGHTQSHLCLFHERTHSLFTGDHIPGGSGTVIIDPPDGDMAAYLASLERLRALPVETLFPGHGSPQGAAKRRIGALIAHRLGREEKVVAALGAEARSIPELVERAYADTPRELWPYAERSLLAHLIKLEKDGKAVRDGGRWRRA
jgi:glyoxylase-like metal-dependent hydrolase (beta-lactamase superfamily II)/8-oxo-dGTP pyrophosphatase MutT (NUDIX family)